MESSNFVTNENKDTLITPPILSPTPKPKHTLLYSLIAILIVLVAGIGFVLMTKSVSKEMKSEKIVVSDQYEDWQTYRNEEYDFEFKYPKDWKYQTIPTGNKRKHFVLLGPNTLSLNGGGLVEVLVTEESASEYESFLVSSGSKLTNKTTYQSNEFSAIQLTITSESNKVSTDYRLFSKDSLLYVFMGNSQSLPDEISTENCRVYECVKVYEAILSTFKFIESSPVIHSIVPSSGKIGTIVALNGEHLAGFESDMDAWIENVNGEIGYLPSYTHDYTQSKKITVQIGDKVCKKNNSYTGFPCAEYMIITPGKYKIFTQPWGVESNKVLFEVIK